MKHYNNLIHNLLALASTLDNEEHSAFDSVEDDTSMAIVSEALVHSANIIKEAARRLETLEANSSLDLNDVEDLFNLVTAAEETGDPDFIKQASVLDALLISVCENPEKMRSIKKAQSENIDTLREKLHERQREQLYKEPREIQKKEIKADSVLKNFEHTVKQYRPNEASLSARCCPDHAGAPLMRIADGVYQCDMDKKKYDWNAGFTTINGNVVPGSSVSEQTNVMENVNFSPAFTTRDHVLNDRN